MIKVGYYIKYKLTNQYIHIPFFANQPIKFVDNKTFVNCYRGIKDLDEKKMMNIIKQDGRLEKVVNLNDIEFEPIYEKELTPKELLALEE